MQCHAWEININVEGFVEVVGEDIQRNMSDDFGDLSIREALVAKRLYAARRHLPTLFQQFTRKRQRRGVLGRGALPLAAVENLLVGEARELADCGVSGHAIFAAVVLSYCQGNFLPQFRIEGAL